MGDRTTVTLTILNEHTNKVREIAEDFDYEYPGGAKTNCIQFFEVNYGELDFLKKLESLGIAYESAWDNGSEYSSGTKYCRFDSEGLIDIKEIYDNQRNPNIETLMNLIENPDSLIRFIRGHHENISVLPWDNQAEYGRIYAALHLITPKL